MKLILAATAGLLFTPRRDDWLSGKQIRSKIVDFIREQDIGERQSIIVATPGDINLYVVPRWSSETITRDAGHRFDGDMWAWTRITLRNGRGGAAKQRKAMVYDATHALIFWDGKSKGTADLITKVEEKKIPYCIHVF